MSKRQPATPLSQLEQQHSPAVVNSNAAAAAAAAVALPEQHLGRKRARRSPRLFPFFTLLAAIECQLVLQMLDNRSRLAVAKCSRRMEAEAFHPFSWKYAETELMMNPVTAQLSRTSSLIPRRLVVKKNDFYMDEWVQHLVNTPWKFFGVDLGWTYLGSPFSFSLLRMPVFANLKQLITPAKPFSPYLDPDVQAIISGLESLVSIHLSSANDADPSLLTALCLNPRLTELALGSCGNTYITYFQMEAIQGPCRLQRLHLLSDKIMFSFDKVFRSAVFAEIRMLAIHGCMQHIGVFVASVNFVDFALGLRHLPRLEEVSFTDVSANDFLEYTRAIVQHAPRKMSLIVRHYHHQYLMPSEDSFNRIRQASTDTHVDVDICFEAIDGSKPHVYDARLITPAQLASHYPRSLDPNVCLFA